MQNDNPARQDRSPDAELYEAAPPEEINGKTGDAAEKADGKENPMDAAKGPVQSGEASYTDETEAGDQPEETPQPKKTEVQILKEERDALNDRLFRTLAEYDNYRKRSAKEKEELFQFITAQTVGKFLPVLDNLERALAAETSDAEYKKGVEMIYTTFQNTLQGLQVEEIGAEGEVFNPDIHDAVMHVEDESAGENVVVQVLQKGYRIGDKVLRFAMVKTAN